MQHWLIYALGAGWGHVNRAIALGRQLAKHNTVHILTNSPYVSWMQTPIPQMESNAIASRLHLHILSHRHAASREQAIATVHTQVQALVLSHPWTGLMVDTFPRGLVGELADLLPKRQTQSPHCRRILIQRSAQPIAKPNTSKPLSPSTTPTKFSQAKPQRPNAPTLQPSDWLRQ